jgi:hypothetical protein
MADFDLNAFLAEQQAAGTSQGEGDFTVSHEKAAQKMSQYSLPREHAWVLKIVQAAVAWKCNCVKLTQTRTDSTFTFQTDNPADLPTNQELVTAILRVDAESGKPLESLGAALRILVEKSSLSFMLLIDRGVAEPQAIYAGVYFGEMDEKSRAKHREAWDGSLNLKINHVPHTHENRILLNYIPVRDHALGMLLEMERYSYVCPIPLFADGRRLDGVLRSSALKWSSRKKPIRVAGLEIPGDDDPRFPICEGFANQILTVDLSLKQVLEKSIQGRDCEAYFVMSLETRRTALHVMDMANRSTLLWVRNGVIVEEENIPIATRCLGLTVFASAEGLRSDLTGFQLTRNEAFTARRTRILERLEDVLLLEIGADRKLFPVNEPPPDATSPEEPEPSGIVTSLSNFVHGFVVRAKRTIDEIADRQADWDEPEVSKYYERDLTTLHQELLGKQIVAGDKSKSKRIQWDDVEPSLEVLERVKRKERESRIKILEEKREKSTRELGRIVSDIELAQPPITELPPKLGLNEPAIKKVTRKESLKNGFRWVPPDER